MGSKFVIYGSWKVRHNEPIHKEDEHLVWVELKEQFAENTQRFTINSLHELDFIQSRLLIEDGNAQPTTDLDEDWFLANIPLAIVFEEGGSFRINFGTLQIESHRTTFMKLNVPLIAPSREHLFNVLCQLYEEQHLYFNNHECFYIQSKAAFTKQYSTTDEVLCMDEAYRLGEAFEKSMFPGFQLKMTDSWHRYNYDQYTFCAPVLGDSHYITEMHKGKKREWNAPLYEYLHIVMLENGKTNYEQGFKGIRPAVTPPLAMLKENFGYGFKEFPGSRHSAHAINVESEYGNIFDIQFSTIQVHQAASAAGRFQPIEIRYRTTCGWPDEVRIEEDFTKLVQEVELYLSGRFGNLNEINKGLHDFLEMYLEGSSRDYVV